MRKKGIPDWFVGHWDNPQLELLTALKKLFNRPIALVFHSNNFDIEKKFVCEEFIDDGSGGFPIDYKFMCIHSKVHCILGVSGREDGHGSYFPYTLGWKPIPEYYRGDATASEPLPRPANLEEMIRTAEHLAEGIELVRVDLYSNGSRIWFGEMTLTPAGCIFHRWTQKALDDMGKIYRNEQEQ